MNNHAVIWFEMYVQDMERAKQFYERVLQLTLERLVSSAMSSPAMSSPDMHSPDMNSPAMDMWSFPMDRDGPGAGGALVRMEGVPSGGNSTLVYFKCSDCALEASRVVAAGGKLQREKMAIGEYGFIALAVDTEGNMFGLHSMQ